MPDIFGRVQANVGKRAKHLSAASRVADYVKQAKWLKR